MISSIVIVLALFGAPVAAQSSGSSSMELWKLLAIIIPSAVGGLTLLSIFIFCCCCRRNYKGGDMMCGDCSGGGGCCGPRGGCDCGPGSGCDCGPGGCCGPRGGCNCGPGACDCGTCCGDCCYDGRHQPQHTVYSSQQGPIQVQPAYQGRNYPAIQPAVQTYFSDPTYVSSLPVGPKYGGGVYGGAPRAPVYSSGPVVRGGGGCGCG